MTARRAVLAIDVGGTTIKTSLVDADGTALAGSTRATPVGRGPDAVVDAVRASAAEFAGAAAAIGVVVPGAVDTAAGVARYAANLGWREVPLRALLAADTGLPTVLDHDVRAAGVAERTIGAAAGSDDCLIVVIGTGIAGLVVSGGTLVTGATGLGGEIGHLPVRPDGRPCACGQRGCLEVYASAAAIARRYAALTGRAEATAAEVAQLWPSDELAAAAWLDAADALGVALVAATMLLDPELIVLGGGLAEAGAALLGPVRTALAGRVAWRPAPAVQLSPLAARAGRVGAAILAWRSLGVDDFASWPAATAAASGPGRPA